MKNFLKKVVCSTPGLGHVIAIGVYVAGREELAKDIFIDATRTTAIVTSVAALTVAAAVAGGPVVVAGIVIKTSAGAAATVVAGGAAGVVVAANATGRTANFHSTQEILSRARREQAVDWRPVPINSKPETNVDLERQGPKPSGSSIDKSQGKEAHPVTPQSQGNYGFALGMGFITIGMLFPLIKIRPVTTMSKYLILQAKEVTRTPLLRLGLSRLTAVTLPTASPSSSLVGTNAKESRQHNQKQQQSQQQSLNQSSASRGGNSGRFQQKLTQSGGQRGNEPPNGYERNKESNEERLIQVRRDRAELENMLSMNGVEDPRRLLREITQYARELNYIVHSPRHFPDLQYLTQREREETEDQYNYNVDVAETVGWPRLPMPGILQASSQRDEFYRNNNVICVIQDTDGQNHVGYSLRLAQARIETRHQDIRYRLVSQFPNIRPRLSPFRQNFRYFEGWLTNEDTSVNELTRCAEHMAYESLQNLQRVPRYTYSIMFRDGRVIFREPCPNCRQYPERQVFGRTVTKNMNKKIIPLEYDYEFDGQSQ